MKPAITIALVAAAIVLVAVALYSRTALFKHLPPKTECVNEGDALNQAKAYAKEHGGMILKTSGDSMEPWIVGHAVGVFHRPTWKDVPIGSVIMYYGLKGSVAKLEDGRTVDGSSIIICHVLSARYSDGRGIGAGLNTHEYERWNPISEDNFVGVVDAIFTWPQPPKP